jgi:hypothetical protein
MASTPVSQHLTSPSSQPPTLTPQVGQGQMVRIQNGPLQSPTTLQTLSNVQGLQGLPAGVQIQQPPQVSQDVSRRRLGSVAGPVIQATGRSELENG